MKLHFRKLGEGPPVVILHGLLGSSDNWQTFGKMLAESNFTVYMADLRNHGLSPHHETFDLPDLAEDVKELIAAEQPGGVFLIGHSLGGKTAMTLAYRYPELIKGLVVVDIAPRLYPVHHRQILETLLSVPLESVTSRKEVETMMMSRLNDPVNVQFLMKGLYRKESDRFGWRYNVEAISRQIGNVGKPTYPPMPVTLPAIFIRGENSDYITADDEKDIREHFKNSEVLTAPDAGHWVHADNPEWLLESVKDFLLKNN